MPTNALAAICGDIDLGDGKNMVEDSRLVVAARLHIAHGKDRRHRPCLDALIHDRTAGRVVMASITYLDDEGLKIPSPGRPYDAEFEAWADRNDEIAGRIVEARDAARRTIECGAVVPRPRELIFDIASRVPAAQ
ncbi:hypothetical protein VQ042_06545 [Aurantimonas sp. A2-1-M11]|uniref:hypothetical protein n=1 Tax=Aurantimonas sp. A2-1-M11 TaxID=3113712 RepID=UPI002F952C93